MRKIKYTKNELKAQRDNLNRFQRFLPTLELKREQLQLETRRVEAAVERKKAEESALLEDVGRWVALFASDIDFSGYLKVSDVRRGSTNIAGVVIPIFKDVIFAEVAVDLFETPAWLDDGLAVLKKLAVLRAEQRVLVEQLRLLSAELLVTSQRVNLFEKVKIPQASENIRVIRIFLGDLDAAGVVRAKIAKRKAVVRMKSA